MSALLPRIDHLRTHKGTRDSSRRLYETRLEEWRPCIPYNIYSGRASGFGIDLTGKVKLNTADFGLHRGRNDYAAQADAYQSFDNFTALGSLGYKFLGNP